MLSSTKYSNRYRHCLASVANVLACHAGKPVAIKWESRSVGLWYSTYNAENLNRGAMTDEILTIIFGCLASVLAIASIILTCLQLRAHIRQSAHNETPSAMEKAPSLMWTASDHRRLAPGSSTCPNILPIMIFDGLVLASVSHCARRSTCYA
jgi:hypothetical protein